MLLQARAPAAQAALVLLGLVGLSAALGLCRTCTIDA
jgi:hypothetical protein